MTAADAIARSLRLCGVLDHNENPSAQMLSHGITALNGMISRWGAEKNAVYSTTSVNISLTQGTSTYTIGSGGDINTARPKRITTAFIRYSSVDYPIEIIDQKKYNSNSFKTSPGMPYYLYYIPDYPLASVVLYPVPDVTGYDLYLDLWSPLSTYSSVTASLGLPPEYEDAICFNMAVFLGMEYPGSSVSQLTIAAADSALNTVKRLNSQPVSQIQTNPFIANRRSNIWGGD